MIECDGLDLYFTLDSVDKPMILDLFQRIKAHFLNQWGSNITDD